MLIFFFDIKGAVMKDWVLEESINDKLVLLQMDYEKIEKKVQRKRPKLWKNGFVFQQTLPSQ